MSSNPTTVREAPRARWSLPLCAAVVVLYVVIRLVIFHDALVPLTYALPLLICVWSRDRRQLWGMAALFAGMATVELFWILPTDVLSPGHAACVYAATLINIFVGAGVVHAILRLRDALEQRNAALATANEQLAEANHEIQRQNEALQQTNHELEAANEELAAREEEITRQNEELRAQAEELAEQNEELRVQGEELEQQAEELRQQAEELQTANDELGQRERLLQNLFSFSGSFTGQHEVLTQVCQHGLCLLGEDLVAAAVLELHGDEVCVHAHRGLNGNGDGRARWPAARSLARIAIAENRVTALDDIALRPDFAFPAASDGRSCRAALSAPLRIDQQAVGAVEFYAASPRAWTDDHFRLAEWIAAQAALALQAVRLRDALQASAARFRTLADAIPQLAWMTRPDGWIEWYNRRWYEYTGTTPEQMEGWGWKCVHDPRTLPEVLERWNAALRRGEEFEMVFPLRGADGEYRPFLTRALPVKDEHGRVVHWFGTNTEITELQRTEAALRRSEARYRKLHEALRDGFVQVTMDGRIAECNETYCQLLGYTSDELRALTYQDLTPDRWHARETEIVRAQVLPRGYSDVYEKEYRRKDGRIVPVELRTILSTDEEGRPAGMWALVRDISERRRAERERLELLNSERQARSEAERASRIKDEFLATLSHELRTPLGAILGWIQMLRQGRLPASESVEAMRIIEDNARLQKRLIEDLLDMGRIMSGKLKLDFQPTDIALVTEEAVAMFGPEAATRNIRLESVVKGSAGHVLGDPGRLKQVLGNLLSNALKFTPAGGRVRVRLIATRTHALIAVKDTGIGIPPEFLARLFERFSQADATTTRKYRGLGLGLSLVRQVVELHGGLVRARSRGEGCGAMFVIRLPLLSTLEIERAGRVEPCDVDLAGVTALVAEDEPSTLALIARVLREAGAEVTACCSAAQALSEIEQREFHVVVSDISMPGEDGYSLMRRIRQLPDARRASTPGIALTAFSRSGDRSRAFEAGFQSHLVKPVDANELCAAVSNLARRS